MTEAPGKPGICPTWTTSAKIGVGTACSADSNTWFTLSHGIVNEVYWPRIDIANLRDFGFIVTDEAGFFSEERRNCVHDYATVGEGIPAYRLTNTCNEGRYKIEKTIIADPRRNVLLQHIVFTPLKGKLSDYKLFALASPHLLNAGYGNDGYVGEYKGVSLLVATRQNHTLAIGASTPFAKMSVGYVGHSDGWQLLKKDGDLKELFTKAENGNIALTGQIDLEACQGKFTIALAFGSRLEEAAIQVRTSLMRGFEAALDEYVAGWREAQSHTIGLKGVDKEGGALAPISYAVLKTHQGKHFTGSVIASLSIPWGTHRGDHDLGGYHLIWPRDQVMTADAFLAVNDLDSARQIFIFLMATQEKDGHFPQNMWDDGKSYWSKVQLDETALPILLAGELHKANYLKKIFPFDFIKKGAGYILKKGPITEQDRWEEAHGLSTYTLAVVIASFLVAADFLEEVKMDKEAEYLRDAADWWNYSIEDWLYVKNTPLAKQIGVEGYYIRINPSCTVIEDPTKLDLFIANRPEGENIFPASRIVSIDALTLVRYGLRKADDPRILNTVKVIDAILKTETPRGPVWHRYNEDGYGEKKDGSAFDGTGIGRGWPLLTGERAHYELQLGNNEEALRLLRVMASMAGTGGLFPEQVWDQADVPEHVLFKGHSTGAAKPLVWAHAEYLSLLRSINDGAIFAMPDQTAKRYLKKKNKPKIALWQMKAQFSHMPKGLKLRIQVPERAIIRYSHDEWKSQREVETAPNGFEEWYCDIEGGVKFTIYWADRQEWQGQDFQVQFYS